MVKIISLKSQKDFDAINKTGKKKTSKYFILVHAKPSKLDQNQEPILYLGLKVSKKVGCAVIRNKIKRRFKALARDFANQTDQINWNNHTLIFIPRFGIAEAPYSSLLLDLQGLVIKI